MVNFPLNHFRAVLICLSDDCSRLYVRSAETNRPGRAPVISPKTSVDLRRSTELRHHDDERCFQHASFVQIVDQRRECLVELTELLQVEIEVLVVRVVVRV